MGKQEETAVVKRKMEWKEPELPPTELYLDDLLQIQQILEELGPVKVDSDMYEISSLDDLTKVPETRMPDIRFRVGEPIAMNWMTIRERYINWHGVIASDHASVGAAAMIADVIRARAIPIWRRRKFYSVLGIAVAIFTMVMTSGRWSTYKTEVLAFSGIIGIGFGLFSESASKYTIVPRYRSDSPTYWKRNKDTIITSRLLSAVTGAVAYGLGRLQGNGAPTAQTSPATQPATTRPASP